MTADEILEKIMQDGKVDVQEVNALENMVKADWVVDHHEVELLFKVNNAIGDNDEACPQWTKFFIATVTRLLVADMDTPGTIDTEEGNWLGNVFEKYSVGNKTENDLMHEIKNTTTAIHGKIGEVIKPYE